MSQERIIKSSQEARVGRVFVDGDLNRYSLEQRLMIKTLDTAFYFLIRAFGASVRFKVEGWEHFQQLERQNKTPIFAFWHNRIFLSTYFWRNREIVVMTSQSFDGEYIARFIKRFGYGAARGSTTRGGVGALIEMVRQVKSGKPAAFTVDGPKGPANIAQAGAVLLAKKTGAPILPFSINAAKFYRAPSWDKLQIPLPFTTAQVRIGAPMYVAKDADDAAIEGARARLQVVLESLSL